MGTLCHFELKIFQILRMHTVLKAKFLQIWTFWPTWSIQNKMGLFSLVQMMLSPFQEFSAYEVGKG